MMLYLSLLASCLFCGGLAASHELGDTGEPCEPGIADTCFSSVSKDIRMMLDLRQKTTLAVNVTKDAVLELCLALEDALNCTSDIIDDGCSDSEGRDSFDAWVRALRASLRYVCAGAGQNKAPIRDILLGISCWDLEDFIFCTENEGNLTHIRDLLHTKLGDEECGILQSVTSRCFRAASRASCREQENVPRRARKMLDVFLEESGCARPAGHELEPGSAAAALPTLIPAALSFLLLALFTSQHQ
ncbi:uncharacterized protein LOC129217016 [Uloborus diversus]|uniref:uncharacterized protein LOC129217016 n=1 Tax=Uloborus diversus TaxID=327109 RepID=UPI0024096E68|nr:uncharacterized protein LOC129217016 [Uloborus diversus]